MATWEMEHRMSLIRKMAGSGWLRTRLYGSSTAKYQLEVTKHLTGLKAGTTTARGVMQTEYLTMVAARSAGAATLVLASGASVSVRLTSVDVSEAAFEIGDASLLT